MNLSHPEMNRRKRAGPTARGCGLVTVLATALTTPDPAAAQGPHDAVLSGEVGAYTVTGRSFEAWGRILGDEVMAAALVDRLLPPLPHRQRQGNSYRMRRHAKLSKAIRPLGSRIGSDTDPGQTAS